jgi:hypothetical protein
MTFKKIISYMLITTQMGVTSMAFASAATSQAPTATPEFQLLSSVIALQGQKLTQQQARVQLSADVNHYTGTAPTEGQQLRFQQALVDLGVYTSQQASSFVTSASAQALKLGAAQPGDKVSTQVASDLYQIASLHPTGAQFSACDEDANGWGWAGVGVGGTGLLISLIVADYYSYEDKVYVTTKDYNAGQTSLYMTEAFGAVFTVGLIVALTSGCEDN